MINDYLPWDEKMDHIHFRSKFIRQYKIWDHESGYYKNYVNTYFINWLKMLDDKKVWKTTLYEFISFKNIINNKTIVFLKFENIEDFKKWRKIKPKNSAIKKIYYLLSWKIQANIEITNDQFFRIKYFEWSTEIWVWIASQLNLL
jgi:hypothetical protein